jgi:hypothetical protein
MGWGDWQQTTPPPPHCHARASTHRLFDVTSSKLKITEHSSNFCLKRACGAEGARGSESRGGVGSGAPTCGPKGVHTHTHTSRLINAVSFRRGKSFRDAIFSSRIIDDRLWHKIHTQTRQWQRAVAA